MPDPTGAALILRVLGATEVVVRSGDEGGGDALARQPKRLALLAYLALHTADGFCRREHLVSLFWPEVDPSQGRTNLRKALHAIRQAAGADVLVTRGEDELRLDTERVWCDAVALGAHIRHREWDDALALFRGDLLDGLNPEGVAQELEEWLSGERRALRKAAARAAGESSRAAEGRGDWDAAVAAARRAIELDVDDEGAVRRVLDLLDRRGDRAGALRLYEEWRARLQKEFGVVPSPETRALVRGIMDARIGDSLDLLDALRRLRRPPPHRSAALHEGAHAVPRAVPWRRRPPVRVAAIAALVVIATTAAGWFWRSASADLGPRSVTVLPVRALDPALAREAAALGEELTIALGADSTLVVRATARLAEGAAADLERVARRLGVAWLVDGAVQGSDSGARVTLRLVRARDVVAVWSASYDLPSRGAASVAPAAREAAGAIGRAMGGVERR